MLAVVLLRILQRRWSLLLVILTECSHLMRQLQLLVTGFRVGGFLGEEAFLVYRLFYLAIYYV